jgi:DNA-binding Lrp family transcriptional regulator
VPSTLESLLSDPIDQQIVALLHENARQSFAGIGEVVGLSAPAVKRRVDRLEEAGVILGYTARVDPRGFGLATDAFIELICRGKTSPSQILSMVRDEPAIIAAYTVTGDADALLHVRTRDTAELEGVLERIRSHPNADRTRSTIVLSRLLDRRTLADEVG